MERLALEGSGIDSPLGLTLRARARLIRAADGAEIYAHTFGYYGREHRLLREWAASGATLLQQELDRAYGEVAEKIVTDVFLLDPHSREIEEEASAPSRFLRPSGRRSPRSSRSSSTGARCQATSRFVIASSSTTRVAASCCFFAYRNRSVLAGRVA